MDTSTQPVAVLQPSDTTTALALAEALDSNAQNTKTKSNCNGDSSEDSSKYLWYLAYGSNLNSKVFRGRRGIRPHAARPVLAPGLQLAFDLPGVPYLEPRFANCRVLPPPNQNKDFVDEAKVTMKKDAKAGAPEEVARVDSDAKVTVATCNDTADKPALGDGDAKKQDVDDGEEELTALVARLHHGCWTGEERAMLGVAYLVSPHDFARILATEGGGASYRMVAVDARVLRTPGPRTQQRNEKKKTKESKDVKNDNDNEKGVVNKRKVLTGEIIRAFTLVAPPEKTRTVSGQPSLRYLNLIREGAKGK